MGDSDAARLDALSTAPVASSPPGAGREERLVAAAVAGDAAAFAALYDRHLDRVYRYCYYRTGSRPDAEDLAEELRRVRSVSCGTASTLPASGASLSSVGDSLRGANFSS